MKHLETKKDTLFTIQLTELELGIIVEALQGSKKGKYLNEVLDDLLIVWSD